MVFASPLFLLVFLPLVLAAHFLLPRRAANFVLLAASAAFYIWGEGVFIALVLASIAFNWAVGLRIEDADSARSRRRWFAFGVGGNLAVLGVFKYANFALANVSAAMSALHWGRSRLPRCRFPWGFNFSLFIRSPISSTSIGATRTRNAASVVLRSTSSFFHN